jgi:hypothetical protein
VAKRKDPSSYEMPDGDDVAMKAEVLVEYDGPRVVLFRSPKVDRLGIVVEPGVDPEHWILARVSKMELEELARGALPVRDVFSHRDDLRWLELDGKWKPLRARTIGCAEIPDGILPVRGAPLPDTSRPYLFKLLRLRKERSAARRIRLDGSLIRDNRIAFAALAQIAQALQNFWSSIGETLGLIATGDASGIAPTTLLAEATGRGSFVLNVHAPDEQAFDRVLVDYRRIVRGAFDDDVQITEELSANAPLARSLDAYLKTLETWGAEAVIEAPATRSYVGHSSARSIRAALKPAPSEEADQPDERPTRKLAGYFVAFDMGNAEFQFHHVEANETITGKIAANLAKGMRERGDKEATVGLRTRYAVTIEERHAKSLLVAFSKAQGELAE